MSKVYVVCEPTHRIGDNLVKTMDLSPALQYGELEILLPNSQSLYSPVPTVRALREKLKDFSDEDYILPVGDPVLISTVAMVAGEINNGQVTFLKWDKPTRKYLAITVDSYGRSL